MPRGETHKITKLIDASKEILSKEWPMTIRQLFYRLVVALLIENCRADYRKTSRIMTTGRLDGRIEWEWIVDRSRIDYEPCVWTNPAEYVQTLTDDYRKDYWTHQPAHVGIWVEKDAIVGSIQKVTSELGVIVRPGRGFQSTTKVHEIAVRFASITKPIFVYYAGDHDSSGRNAEDELRERIHLHCVELHCKRDFHMERLAIHKEDIQKFKLPPQKVKDTDSRAAGFRKRFGAKCVELDALPVAELRNRIRDAVTQHINIDLWNRAIRAEVAETKCILNFSQKLQGLTWAV